LIRGRAAPVIAGAALVLAGCTASMPLSYPIQSKGTGGTWPIYPVPPPDRQTPIIPNPTGIIPLRPPAAPPSVEGNAPAAPPVKNDPPPLVAIEPPALRFPPLVTPLTPPADATDCTGYWRICHFY
jgi:hypothetical protein